MGGYHQDNFFGEIEVELARVLFVRTGLSSEQVFRPNRFIVRTGNKNKPTKKNNREDFCFIGFVAKCPKKCLVL